ncbi:MAG: STAS domain-containing protein [Planctomycetota bacterium]|jgi:anti-anti-sigma regulatory factor
MSIPPGYCLLAFTIDPDYFTTTPAILIYGLGALALILWILSLLLLRGGAGKGLQAEVVMLRGRVEEVKDLLDGLHESVGRFSDGLEFFREKVDNRMGSVSRSLESLPRLNEGLAGIRETITGLQKALAGGAPAGLGAGDSELKEQFELAREELQARDAKIAELQEEISGFHETLQASALAEEQGSDEGVFKVKLAEVEEAKKQLEAERASFERNQTTIKGQIKEAGEKLKQAKEEIRLEREKLEKARAASEEGAEAGASQEEKERLEKEWEAIQQQESVLKGEQEWVESERKALEEEREELERLREAFDREKAEGGEAAAGQISSAGLALPETEVIEGPPPADAGDGVRGDTSSEELHSWGYSSLAPKEAEGGEIREADEEDITSMAETATDEKSREEWEAMVEETGAKPPEHDTHETAVDQDLPPIADSEEAEGGLPAAEEEDLPGLAPPPDEGAIPAAEENLPPEPEAAAPAGEQDLAVEGPPPAIEQDIPVEAPDAPDVEEEPPEAPVSEAGELDVWEDEGVAVPDELPPAPVAAPKPADEGERLEFTQRAPGIEVAAYAGIFAVRTGFEEMKNDQAHALDEVIFSETSDKEDRILLDLNSLKYINSRGLSSITKVAVQRTAHIVLTNDNVLKIMDMMGFLPLFTLFENLEEALDAFGETEV